ncbi:hypothetical protein CONLIGDRAFT_686865 [Coniochaeta ligniaria NRRL 30616]|uniref:Peptidase S1 domain-containing protein n=1 Tax=Coniochaeta ligniaria NRRL 30616 TaxID=1408157 RepID=A0A1J7I6M5_9PEZI|nr:hypothetical protein CONLIGDRAFT_686865 [Coniochaeta ligniaria NRRL 30616]
MPPRALNPSTASTGGVPFRQNGIVILKYLVARRSLPSPLQSFIALRDLDAVDYNSNRPHVYKLGRTTGPTVGEVSSCRAVTRTGSVTSVETTLVPKPDLGVPEAFAWKGDSGAAVFAGDGTPHSMVWGAPRQSTEAGEAYLGLAGVVCATPIEAVLRDIQERLAGMNPDVEVRVYLA